ncbi:Tryprostatin B 6-hydroxylase [Podospora aff. communis PSN243]|uniref:Tryprostatin B 6-hydroxylase n=1 Tax=Podospora aff. communis PSN243 TaxID=3040156 RepID=A0AAV9H6H4_9PEZI|nr:Tryprostatin B 6-hydroxylase [Podospora aff. communis PSN243]
MNDFLLSWGIISSSGLAQRCLLATATGVLIHLVYFIRGFHDTSAHGIFVAHTSIYTVLAVAAGFQNGFLSGFTTATAIFASYLVGLFSSIIIYRIFFHRLRRFPGPLFAKMTKLYSPWTNRNDKMHLEQNKLFDIYGDIVRVGPNDLAILSTDALPTLHSSKSKCTKRHAGIYSVVHYNGTPNLDSITDREEHRWRRQVWERAMTTSAQAEYEKVTRTICRTWLNKISSLNGGPIDTSLFSLLITFDHMGKVGFSHDFNTIQAGKEDHMLTLLEVMFGQVAKVGEIAWPVALVQGFNIGGEAAEFDELTKQMADTREREDSEDKKDIFKHLLADFRSEKPTAFFHRDVLYADAGAILVGATDTIAAALAYSFYQLAAHQDVQETLFDEISPLFGKTVPGEFANADLSKVEYLDAVINESMRLDNPTTNAAARMVPPEGIVVDGVFIPGGTSVRVPVFALQRSEKYFVRAEEFIPERWTTKPEMVRDRAAFMPFNMGPNNCVGKRLAMMVLRLVLSYTTYHYQFGLAPGEDGTAIHREAKNKLIIKAGPLKLVFARRDCGV